jgi:hypothetical protein
MPRREKKVKRKAGVWCKKIFRSSARLAGLRSAWAEKENPDQPNGQIFNPQDKPTHFNLQ